MVLSKMMFYLVQDGCNRRLKCSSFVVWFSGIRGSDILPRKITTHDTVEAKELEYDHPPTPKQGLLLEQRPCYHHYTEPFVHP